MQDIWPIFLYSQVEWVKSDYYFTIFKHLSQFVTVVLSQSDRMVTLKKRQM